ncbi:MAG: hypothetical protein RHS_4970 [Robinsoniella sp. RHS]|nr:MAG: hypothetical protein RHS_4970 [Robinsoniella sp. RHS]
MEKYLQYINKYMKDYPIGEDGNLFLNKNGYKLTCSGVRTRIDTIAEYLQIFELFS